MRPSFEVLPTMNTGSSSSYYMYLSLLALLFVSGGASNAVVDIPVGSFSNLESGDALPEGWEELKLGKAAPTEYRLVEYNGNVVVQAISEGTASGLIREVDINPDEYPVITWEWKVSNVLEKGDLTQKDGDDFAARLYITFDYSPKNLPFGERIKYRALRLLGYKDIPLRALNYVWSNKAPEGTMAPNAYTDWVTMIALQSGEEHSNTWKFESRNLYKDFIDAFGEEPGAITGIAIMTDTDNTGESAMAYYGDITVSRD